MVDFIWRKVSEEERKEIAQKSKNLLEQFSQKISKVKVSSEHFENDSGMRPDGEGWETDEEFKSTVFENAPFVEDNLIIVEKGAWK